MNKKLIITEEQYKKLKFHLLESTFDTMANKIIKKGDTITITSNGRDFNFKVADNYGGQIYMDNIDDGTKVFLTKTSFQNNSLQLNIAQNNEEKNQNPPKGETWKKMTMKNVEKIDVSRDGEIIDGTELDPEELANIKKEKNKNLEKKVDFLETLNSLNDGETLNLESEEINLELVFLKKEGDEISFKISKNSQNETNIKNVELIVIDTKKINVDEKGNVIVNFEEHVNVKGDENSDDFVDIKNSKLTLKDWEIGTESSEDKIEDEEEPNSEDEGEEEEEESKSKIDPEKFKEMLMNDPQLRAAFYSKPSFFQSFWAELTSKNPNEKATGFILVKNLLDSYSQKKISEKLGAGWKSSGVVIFEPLEDIDLPYKDVKGNELVYTLEANRVYGKRFQEEGVIRKKYNLSNYGDYDLTLQNEKFNYEIIVKEQSDNPDVFICDVIKFYTVPSPENPKKRIKVESEPVEDVKIKFLQSLGYVSEENQENKEQK